jgi:hypothetical protein
VLATRSRGHASRYCRTRTLLPLHDLNAKAGGGPELRPCSCRDLPRITRQHNVRSTLWASHATDYHLPQGI